MQTADRLKFQPTNLKQKGPQCQFFFILDVIGIMTWLRWNGIQRKFEVRVSSMDAQSLSDSSRTYFKCRT